MRIAPALLFLTFISGCVHYGDTLEENMTFTAAFVANNQSDNVSAYLINSKTGKLTGNGSFSTGGQPVHIAMHPTNKFAFAVNSASNSVSVFKIDAKTRQLGSAISYASNGNNPVQILLHPDGKFAYVANKTSGTIASYALNADTGALDYMGSVATITNPIGITYSAPNLYVCNAAGTVQNHVINSNGAAGNSILSSVAANAPVNSIRAGGNGKIYLAGNGIVVLTPISSSAFMLSSNYSIGTSDSYGIYLMLSQSYALGVNAGSNTIAVFSVDSTGSLTYWSNVPAGPGLRSLQIREINGVNYAYAAVSQENSIRTFTLSRFGFLTQTDAIETSRNPVAIAAY